MTRAKELLDAGTPQSRKMLAEAVIASVKAGDVEEAVACSKALHDAIGAKTVLAYEAAVEALEDLLSHAELAHACADPTWDRAREALRRLQEQTR